MSEPARRPYYLTTAIPYANTAPGLHTLYEVIGADVLARWHRMRGDDTWFLTGTDEHSVNIAQRAEELGVDTRAFVDEQVGKFKDAEDRLLLTPDRFIRTTDPDHVVASQEMVRRAHANGDVYLGRYEGWYCPSEGFKAPSDLLETSDGMKCPHHPNATLQYLTEDNWFFRLSAYQERLERHFAEHPDFVQPEFRRNEMLAFLRQGLEDFSISREGATWGIDFPIGTGHKIYVWFDALINYITGVGFPGDPDMFAKWWPADLHIIGKDIARFHTLYWPAMLWSAGLEAPKRVWVHGFMTLQGERMSKSRGNFFDPNAMVAALGVDGTRYATLREVPFDRDADVSWDTFLRRYNADLANDFGNLVNRTLAMTARYVDEQRQAPRQADSPLAPEWARAVARWRDALDATLLHEALAALWDFVGAANRFVDTHRPWVLAKEAAAGDADAEERLRGVLGDLLEACRVVGLAAAPFMPETAVRLADQLGVDYAYGADGNGGPPLDDLLVWGAAGAGGSIGTPTPLFPRVEIEEAEPAPA
jgi:methionyl-tRNA synthetase